MRIGRAALFAMVGAMSVTDLACSSDEGAAKTGPNGRPLQTFKDAKGRACTIEQSSLEATCDVAPAPASACATNERACYLTSLAPEPSDAGSPGPTIVKNCDTCCLVGEQAEGLKGSTAGRECAPYVCAKSEDCGGYNADCIDGRCIVP